jgi:hypothetical protein
LSASTADYPGMVAKEFPQRPPQVRYLARWGAGLEAYASAPSRKGEAANGCRLPSRVLAHRRASGDGMDVEADGISLDYRHPPMVA